MADWGRGRFTRPTGWLAMLIAFGVVACSAPAAETGPDPSGTVEVSYAGAVEWLATLDPAQAGQQVQDWAGLGLASALRMSADQLLDEYYDGSVLRDSALDGLAEQPVEPGRALFDDGTLHLLVPADDPTPQRTIGELLDERRADAGTDPAQVQVHTYRIDAPDRKVVLTGRPAEPTARVRAENGWVERRVDTSAALADFLSRTDQLSRLQIRGTEIWAQGWDWPGRSAVVTPADVAVLQRGYRQSSDRLPGFSLDPGPPATAADLRAVLPGLSPALVEALRSGNYAGSGFASEAQLGDAVKDSLFRGDPPAPGLPADRTRLWAIEQQLEGVAPYSQARYDGGLAGTEVGMTLFYTDYVAKDWTFGVGTGVPAGRVPGFVPDDRARTPPSLCPPRDAPEFQSGRLWFGQNDAAFGYGADGVSIGRQATRLFFKTDADGGEVEPGYQFGRGLRWWDRNYRAVADYEPQYRRLEGLMRWAGALEWLTLSHRSLPSAGDPADPGLTFASWYAGHPDLREHAPLAFVRPPSATQEAVLTVPSRAFTDCGPGLRIHGGVSLADAAVRFGELPQRVPLPGGLSRAVPLDRARTSVDAAGTGRITRADSRIYELRRGPGTAEVDTSGPPNPAVRIGEGLQVTDEGRGQSLQIRSDEQGIDVYQEIGDLAAGRTTIRRTENGAQITVVSAPFLRFKEFLQRVRTDPVRGPTAMADFRYGYGDGPGVVTRLDDLWVRTGPPSPATFAETLAAEVRGPRGETLRVAAGAPKTLSAQDTAGMETTGETASSTVATMLDTIPKGTPGYTDSPALVAGAIPLTAPIVVRSTRLKGAKSPAPNAAEPGGSLPGGGPPGGGPPGGGSPGGGSPGVPGGGSPGAPGASPSSPSPTTAPPGAGSPGGAPVGPGPWWLIGFGTGDGTASGGPVLVSDCSAPDPSARPEVCPQ